MKNDHAVSGKTAHPGLDRVLIDKEKQVKKPFPTWYQCIQCITLQFETRTHFCNDHQRSGKKSATAMICTTKNTMERRLMNDKDSNNNS